MSFLSRLFGRRFPTPSTEGKSAAFALVVLFDGSSTQADVVFRKGLRNSGRPGHQSARTLFELMTLYTFALCDSIMSASQPDEVVDEVMATCLEHIAARCRRLGSPEYLEAVARSRWAAYLAYGKDGAKECTSVGRLLDGQGTLSPLYEALVRADACELRPSGTANGDQPWRLEDPFDNWRIWSNLKAGYIHLLMPFETAARAVAAACPDLRRLSADQALSIWGEAFRKATCAVSEGPTAE